MSSFIFIVILILGLGHFAFLFSRIIHNIQLGTDQFRYDQVPQRISQMLLVAFGQKKMFKRPIAALLHLCVYVGFLVVNIEVLEIIIDGIFGTHRFLGSFPSILPAYNLVIAVNEIFAVLVILSCAIFLIRRNVLKIDRFKGLEMKSWPRIDANIILWTEIILMLMLIMFNVADIKLHEMAGEELRGSFPVSQLLVSMFPANPDALAAMAAIGWWGHIIGILLFLNYIPLSKHFHIIMAFPNVYFSSLEPKAKFKTDEHITHEIKAIMDPSYTPPEMEGEPAFGSKDVFTLPWKNLMDSYSCTECGRCTAVCPANITGKKLSPRKIIMDTRDRLEALQASGNNMPGLDMPEDAKGKKMLVHDYTTEEELWACTTCMACVEACPVNIEHLSTIMAERKYLVLEESKAPNELMVMFNNIENNGAPWAMPASARLDWAQDIYAGEN